MSFHCNPAHTRCGYYSFITDFLQPAQLSFKPNHKWFRCQWYYTSQPVVLRLLPLHQQDQFTHHKSQDCVSQICRKQKWKNTCMPFITDEGLRLPPRHSCALSCAKYYYTCTIQHQYCCYQFGQLAHHHGPLQPETMDIQLTFQVRLNSQIFGSQKVQNMVCMQ